MQTNDICKQRVQNWFQKEEPGGNSFQRAFRDGQLVSPYQGITQKYSYVVYLNNTKTRIIDYIMQSQKLLQCETSNDVMAKKQPTC